jgi:hypothetical protein
MTVMITRRTLRRTHLLRPDTELSNLYLYCLGVAAQRHNIAVHAVVLMSTHEHLIVTDPRGRLPLFLRELHRMFALGVKELRKWEGAMWDHERPSVVHLCTPEAIVEKLAYVMANPVAAGLVRTANEWPGVRTLPNELGHRLLTARLPRQFFDPTKGIWPLRVTFELVLPVLPGMDAEALRAAVATELGEHEERARKSVRAKGFAFMGSARVLKASPYDRARSWEPLRSRNPHFAVGKGQREAFFEAVAVLRKFRDAYREALQRWRTGERDVHFPRGTWLMGALHSVNVAAAG